MPIYKFSHKSSHVLASILAGEELPLEFTSAGGGSSRPLAYNVAEIGCANGGRSIVMARLARDGDLLTQVRLGIDRCSAFGRQAHTVIAATGMNGNLALVKRPDLQRLLEILERGEADTVWWHDFVRMSRSREVAEEILDLLRRNNVNVIFGHELLRRGSEQLLAQMLRIESGEAERAALTYRRALSRNQDR